MLVWEKINIDGVFSKIKKYVPPVLTGKKAVREEDVANIVVTVGEGTEQEKKFNGSEESQLRITRALQVLYFQNLHLTTMELYLVKPPFLWKLADNRKVEVTFGELLEALNLMGIKQAELWFKE